MVRELIGRARERWSRLWRRWVAAAFLGAYLRELGDADFLGRTKEERALMLDICLLEAALEDVSHNVPQGANEAREAMDALERVMKPT